MVPAQKIITDEPTRNGILDFDKYSSALSEIISNSTPRFTIGVFGGWGTGKTTLMKMIQDNLDKKNKEGNPKIVTIWFDAWRYENEKHLAIFPLLGEICKGIEKNDSLWRVIGKGALKVFSAFFKGVCSKIVDTCGSDGKSVIAAAENSIKPPIERIERMDDKILYCDILEEFEKNLSTIRVEDPKIRIVVFIDDLDRCFPERALEVIESYKTFLDIEGIVYVIGLNPITMNSIILQKFGEKSGILASDYFKKIVQLPFQIPDWIDEDIRVVLADLSSQTPELNEFLKYEDLIVKAVEWNPRELKRFLNALILAKASSKDEFDISGLVLANALRYRIDWNWFATAVMIEKETWNNFWMNYRLLSENSKQTTDPVSRKLISRITKDKRLKEFLDCALPVATQIEDITKYRRAIEKTNFTKTLLETRSATINNELNKMKESFNEKLNDLVKQYEASSEKLSKENPS